MEEKNVIEEEVTETKTNEPKKCFNCGTELKPDENFCPKCGIKYGETKKIFCPKCNNEVEFGRKFCGKCGAKIDIKTSDKIDFVKNNFSKNHIGKKILIILILIVVLVGVFIAGKKIYSKLSISVDELISQERYSDAYKDDSGTFYRFTGNGTGIRRGREPEYGRNQHTVIGCDRIEIL